MVIDVPGSYKQFLADHGVFEGFTYGQPGYVELWLIDDVARINAEIEIQKYAPGLLAFAGNGGGEVLAFDVAGAVHMLPLIGMEPRYAKRIANSFSELAMRFERAV